MRNIIEICNISDREKQNPKVYAARWPYNIWYLVYVYPHLLENPNHNNKLYYNKVLFKVKLINLNNEISP